MSNETKLTAVDLLWSMIPESTQSYIEHQWNGYKKAKEMEKEEHNITWNNAILSFENEIRKVMKEGKL
jgi:hypothetical protein